MEAKPARGFLDLCAAPPANSSPRSKPASSAKTSTMESAESVCGCLPCGRGKKTFLDCETGFCRLRRAIFAAPSPCSAPKPTIFSLEYNWPGNIRELKDAARAIVALGDETLAMGGLRSLMRRVDRGGNGEKVSERRGPRRFPRSRERNHPAGADANRWNRRRAAQELQISYKALLYKLKQIGYEEYGA